MNKVILMGRLTRDPELRYSQSANPMAVVRYGIAVRRQFVKQGETDVDFFNIVAFGKAGEFANNYFKKGQMVSIVGKLQVNTWEDEQKIKRTSVDVIAEEQHFAESKSSFESREGMAPNAAPSVPNYSASYSQPQTQIPSTNTGMGEFVPNNATIDDDDLPF